MKQSIPEELSKLLPSLKGLECWYVCCGGNVGSTFQLALGEKVRRPFPLANPALSAEFRQFESEVGLLVWCAWRLDRSDGPLTSWDDTEPSVEAGLGGLIGARIDAIEATSPAWDLNIKFSNSLCLRVFCDHVPGEPSFDGNWDLRTPNLTVAVGPGIRIRTEVRGGVVVDSSLAP